MSKLVFDATDKCVHPTRYRQIVETASTRHLSQRKAQFPKTRNTAQSWQRFTIKNNDRVRSLVKCTNFWKSYTATRVQTRNGSALETFRQINFFTRALC